eukprot:171890_1
MAFGGLGQTSPFGGGGSGGFGSSGGSAFGGGGNSSVFGGNTNTGNAFGASNNAFGQQPTGGFGSTAPATPFGGGAKSVFGTNTNAGGFGGFGGGASGASSTPSFGQPATNAGGAFGSNSSPFGKTTGGGFGATGGGGGMFGSNTGAGAFGATTQNAGAFGATTQNAFGATGNTTSGFGSTGGGAFGGAANTGFGASTGSSAFGSTSTGFGSNTGGGMFGQKTNTFGATGNAFGSTNTTGATLGGTGTGFGAGTSSFGGASGAFGSGGMNTGGQSVIGTKQIPFTPVQGMPDGKTNKRCIYACITAMDQYKHKSVEELRMEDMTGKHSSTFAQQAAGQQPASTGGFGSTGFGGQASTGFGPTKSATGFGPTGTTGFGSTGLGAFGKATQSTLGTNAFGASTSGFGGGFGGTGASTGFGALGATTSTGGFGSKTSGAFGSTGGFGSSAFGAAAKPAATGFGATGFGGSAGGFGNLGGNAASSGSMFGSSSLGATSSGFGAGTTTGFGAATTGFGSTGTSVFGGAAKPTNAFGSSAGGFGASTGGMFGQSSAASSGFGANFGSTNSLGTGGFGANKNAFGTTTTGFGGAQPSSGFGNTATPTTSGFGFGQNSAANQANTNSMAMFSGNAQRTGLNQALQGDLIASLDGNPYQINLKLGDELGSYTTANPSTTVSTLSSTPARSLFEPNKGALTPYRPRPPCLQLLYDKIPPPAPEPAPLERKPPTELALLNIHIKRRDLSQVRELQLRALQCNLPTPLRGPGRPKESPEDQASPAISYNMLPSGDVDEKRFDFGESSSESSAPKLKNSEVELKPFPLQELMTMSDDKLAEIPGFSFVHKRFGQVSWPGLTDVRNIDLDKVVVFSAGSIEVYPDAKDANDKPKQGSGLNKPAKIRLINCWPRGKRGYVPKNLSRWTDHLQMGILRGGLGAKFKGWDRVTGDFDFDVEHFTKYAFMDADFDVDEDDIVESPSDLTNGKPVISGRRTGTDVEGQARSVHLNMNPTEERGETLNKSQVQDSAPIALTSAAQVPSSDLVDVPMVDEPMVGSQNGLFSTQFPTELRVTEKMMTDTDRPLMNGDDVTSPLSDATQLIDPFSFAPVTSDYYSSSCSNLPQRGAPARADNAVLRSQNIAEQTLQALCEPIILNNPPANPGILSRDAIQQCCLDESFRVGWSGRGNLAHCVQVKQSARSPVVILDRVKSYGNDLDAKRREVSSILKVHLNHYQSTNPDEDMPVNGERGAADLVKLCDRFVSLLSRSDCHAPQTPESLTRSTAVWMLLKVLFGSQSEFEGSQNASSPSKFVNAMSRRVSFGEWLQEFVHAELSPKIAEVGPNDFLQKIFLLLCANQRVEAAHIASSSGYSRLASILSQSTAGERLRHQVEEWRQSGSWVLFPEAMRKIYSLLIGDVGVVRDLPWYVSLGVHFWHSANPTSELRDVLRAFSESVDKKLAKPPLPSHSSQSVSDDGASLQISLLYSLICLETGVTSDVSAALNPMNHGSGYPLDYSTSFLLADALRRSPLCNLHQFYSACLGFSAQLESMGLWDWAIYVMMFCGRFDSSPSRSGEVAKQILYRQWPLSDDTEHQRISEFARFFDQIGVPSQWIHNAKAQRLFYFGRFAQAAVAFLDGESWKRAHDVFCDKVAPDWIVQGRERAVRSFFQELKSKNQHISRWSSGGNMFLMYFNLLEMIRDGEHSSDHLSSCQANIVEFRRQLNQMLISNDRAVRACTTLMMETLNYSLGSLKECDGSSIPGATRVSIESCFQDARQQMLLSCNVASF